MLASYLGPVKMNSIHYLPNKDNEYCECFHLLREARRASKKWLPSSRNPIMRRITYVEADRVRKSLERSFLRLVTAAVCSRREC